MQKGHIYLFGILGAVINCVAILLVGGFDQLIGLDPSRTVGSTFAFGPRWFGLSALLFLSTPLLVGLWTAQAGFRRREAAGFWHGASEGGAAAALAALVSGIIGSVISTINLAQDAIGRIDADVVDYINGFAIFMILTIFSLIVYFLLGFLGGMIGAAFAQSGQPPSL